ncbi:minor nucleoprotein [Bombali virus]|uniref:Transcriptional activator VP30 n=1 Tax=Bombali virus TaxID=2010960 RepID=A0A343EQG0_9MONO|nr:minor nucleoprotein [Bombali ebolavirus]ASJ82198.1 minor nucleoprotein [Bombali ebolavirus]ASJ82204.1 minor nucleoprotein [Bombali ebolavirus]URC21820.1 virus protein 30 [Bombali ebolavirus]URC21828.1 virus protein 30 [Bombali ebolavirus]WBH05262.1 minor nucleoprotein [Bombali ebolavirus]
MHQQRTQNPHSTEAIRERGRTRTVHPPSRDSGEFRMRARSVSRDYSRGENYHQRGTSQTRAPVMFHKKKTEALLVPPAPKDICPTLKKGFLCDSNFCRKDHHLEGLTDRELLLLIARKTSGLVDPSVCASAPKDARLAHPTAEDFDQQSGPKMTLSLVLRIIEYWAEKDLRNIDDSKLRALLTLCAVTTRKFSKSQLSLLCDAHLRRESLGQDQSESVLEVYQKLHSDKGGHFEAALWQQWDRQSLVMFITAFLNIAPQLPCESSAVVISSLKLLIPAAEHNTTGSSPTTPSWSDAADS